MVIQEGGNFSNGKVPPDADEYRHCNFTYTNPITLSNGKKAGHQIFPGNIKPLKFHRCNMRNCIPPDNAILTNCITPIIESFEAENINGKDCTGFRLYGITDQTTHKAVYKNVVEENFKPNKVMKVTFTDKEAS